MITALRSQVALLEDECRIAHKANRKWAKVFSARTQELYEERRAL
jgi:hypothetical protein